MDDANHATAGVSTFPFSVFGGASAEGLPLAEVAFPRKGDLCAGHDVWFGYESLVLPGVTIGTGAIVGARAVVSRDVPPYAVVAGNPARVVRRRFDAATVAGLLELAWWDWPAERVASAVRALSTGDLAALRRLGPD